MTTPDLAVMWREDATQDEQIAAYQELIDNGQAWRLEGHVGRTAVRLIEDGYCTLGVVGHHDYWGNYVPSRDEVEPGDKGSQEYVDAHRPRLS